MQHTLTGQRVLITQATEFMGPVLCEVFAEQGATVIASTQTLREPEAAQRVVRAAAPAMVARRRGKILVIGSASPARYRSAAWWRRARTPCSRRTCAALPQTALSARCSPFAAGGWRGECAT